MKPMKPSALSLTSGILSLAATVSVTPFGNSAVDAFETSVDAWQRVGFTRTGVAHADNASAAKRGEERTEHRTN